jgi:hypothetical protein
MARYSQWLHSYLFDSAKITKVPCDERGSS